MNFLVVQDDPVDQLLMREDLATHKVVNRVYTAPDARTALAYLDGVPPYGGVGTPDVVLLDPHLPRDGGDVVLERLRTDAATVHVPVILLVDSPAAEQIVRSRGLPVQGYAQKPVDFAALAGVVRSVVGLGFAVHRR
ncbi:response regulator [Paractinoplanes rishiriensis]|uniref:response regulator n=1 Tax=Paractinoplanes rishiriensis TaxID=1050105 RepID=UPI001940E0C4|nr:response regulator [Actinoplanes rishiriensis]